MANRTEGCGVAEEAGGQAGGDVKVGPAGGEAKPGCHPLSQQRLSDSKTQQEERENRSVMEK